MTTLRIVLAMVAYANMELFRMDMKTTFPHGDLHDEIHMQ